MVALKWPAGDFKPCPNVSMVERGGLQFNNNFARRQDFRLLCIFTSAVDRFLHVDIRIAFNLAAFLGRFPFKQRHALIPSHDCGHLENSLTAGTRI
jgi:hypothetical protein